MAGRDDGRELRAQIQTLVRRLGVLSDDKTPCGKDLPVSDAHALQLLREHGPLPQTTFQTLLGLNKSSVSRLRARLERAGRVEPVPSRSAGRPITILELTPQGRRLANELDRASRERFRRLLQHVPDRRHGDVLAALAALNSALGRLDPAEAAEAEVLAKARSVVRAKEQPLTRREREVLPLAAEWLTSAEIARRLSIGVRTVETHRLHISKKLGINDPVELFRYAVDQGLIPPSVRQPKRRLRR